MVWRWPDRHAAGRPAWRATAASLLGRLARSGTDWTPDTALLEATRREAAMLLQQQP